MTLSLISAALGELWPQSRETGVWEPMLCLTLTPPYSAPHTADALALYFCVRVCVSVSGPSSRTNFLWKSVWGFQGALVVKKLSANAGDVRGARSVPKLGRPPGEGSCNAWQLSCLENPMDRGVWWTAVHGVPKSQTRLK